jgi:hypothetical protein
VDDFALAIPDCKDLEARADKSSAVGVVVLGNRLVYSHIPHLRFLNYVFIVRADKQSAQHLIRHLFHGVGSNGLQWFPGMRYAHGEYFAVAFELNDLIILF